MKEKIRVTFGVYWIKCSVGSKSYIGSTSRTFYHRWRDHKKLLNQGKHHSMHLQNAWNKYGEENFSFEILETIDIKDKQLILDTEQDYIDFFYTSNSNFGYNLCPKAGSRLGSKQPEHAKFPKGHIPWNKNKKNEYSLGPHTEESKELMRQKAIGKKHSEETKKRISEIQKRKINSEESNLKRSKSLQGNKNAVGNQIRSGSTHSEVSRKKMSEAHKAKNTSGENNPFFGKKHSEEIRAKLSQLNKGHENLAKSFKIQDPYGNIYEGTNMNKFCKEYNLVASSMSLVKQGKQKHHKGWKFL